MSMYLEHFGLREAPFRITPHTEFFFSGGNRGATLEALVYAVTHDEGIVKVTGEVGSGKTMLCRMLLERLPGQVETIYLANPSLSRDEILFALADELGLSEPPARIHQLLRTITRRLVELYAEGKQIVMLIDEAHAMPADSLEEIRLLSNLESNRHKLLQIVLFGQPELDELLSRNEMRQLRERVTHNFALEPLHRQDIGSYISFRMRAAGYHGPDPFTPSAIQLISESSAGLTRRINILADKALLAAFSENLYQIDTAQAKAAIKDARFVAMPWHKSEAKSARKQLLAGATVLALAGAAGIAWLYFENRQPADAAASNAQTVTAAKPAPPAAAPTAGTAAPAPKAEEATPPAAIQPPAPAPKPSPAPPAVPAAAAPLPQGTAVAPDMIATAATPSSATVQPALSGITSAPVNSALLASYNQSFAAWLPQARDGHYFIQLLRARGNRLREAEVFVDQVAKVLDAGQLRVYRSTVDGQQWLGVIYGEYPSREEAMAVIRKLPAPARANSPYPRSVMMLR